MSKIEIYGNSVNNIPWQDKPFGCNDIVWRHDTNPIINLNPTVKTARVFNSAVIAYKGGFAGIFRADHRDGKAQLHVGMSPDGLNWNINENEIKWVDEDGKLYQPDYAYDPRLVEIDKTYYIIWCTDFGGPSLGLGMTKDFLDFVRLENATIPFNRNGVLFPRKVNGKFLMLSRPSDSGHTPFGDIFISESPDLIHWGKHRRVMVKGGPGWWQGIKIGAGPIPIETTEGWLLFYHGVAGTCNGFVYSMGAVILDIDRPSKVLYRTRDYILTPEMSYETTGFVSNVIFPCATLCDADTGRIVIYYGAADTYVGVAYTKVDELVSYIKANSYLNSGDADDYR